MTNHLQDSLLAQRSVIRALNSKGQRNPLQAGFTLVELLVVVIILAVLSAIAIPAFLNQQGRARISAAQTAVIDAARACAAAATTGDQAGFALPTGVTGTCNAAGTLSTFTADATFGTTGTQPAAQVAANGATNLTVCATAPGWTAGTAPACNPTRV